MKTYTDAELIAWLKESARIADSLFGLQKLRDQGVYWSHAAQAAKRLEELTTRSAARAAGEA